MKNLAPSMDNTEFHKSFIMGTSAVGVATVSRHTILSPPTVNLDLFFSNLSGMQSRTIVPMSLPDMGDANVETKPLIARGNAVRKGEYLKI